MSTIARITRTAYALVLVSAAGVASATAVSAGGSGAVGTLTDLGLFAAGTYELTGTGVVDLVGDGSFLINPDGSYTASGVFGPAGGNARIGALIGSFSAAPSSVADWFLIGGSDSVTLGTAGHLYASVNDTFHDNDTGSFDVEVSAVPEPAPLAFIGGAFLMFALQRRRRG